MGLHTFKGGIHPYDGKELSKDQPICSLNPGKELTFLMSQHIGAPAVPLVAKGDRVLVGQKIALSMWVVDAVAAVIFALVAGGMMVTTMGAWKL